MIMSLAEYIAVLSITAPPKAADLIPVLNLVPIYAQRKGLAIDFIWSMPATHAFAELVGLIPEIITEKASAEVKGMEPALIGIFDPKAIAAKVAEKLATAVK